jgi:integrase
MSRIHRVPSYRHHKQSGQAVVTLTDRSGCRRDILLGKYGSASSRQEYARAIAEWETAGHRLLHSRPAGVTLSINELVSAFWDYAEQHYRLPDGKPSNEQADFRLSLRPLRHLYDHLEAHEFGPLALKAVRQLMVMGYHHPRYGPQPALARPVINQRMGRIRRMFKWAVENELIPPSVLQGLLAVRGLQRGRTPAREPEAVRPVAEAMVQATLPYLLAPTRALVELQLLTGMRPGEAVVMRACDLDMASKVWLYRPGSDHGPTGMHKTAHHGHQRVIAIGPNGQRVLRPFLKLDTRAYLFSPREALEQCWAKKRSERRSKVQPSQVCRKKRRPQKRPGDRYTVASYGRAVASACAKAFPPPESLAKRKNETISEWHIRLTSEQKAELMAWRRAHRWHPHQLRHTAATKIRRELGLDVARVVLGHRTPAITELYAQLDVGRAVEAMEQLG